MAYFLLSKHTDVSCGGSHLASPLLHARRILAAHSIEHAHTHCVGGEWAESRETVAHQRSGSDQRVDVVSRERVGSVCAAVVDVVVEIFSAGDCGPLPHHCDGVGSCARGEDLEVTAG